jgi:hypothetical protein
MKKTAKSRSRDEVYSKVVKEKATLETSDVSRAVHHQIVLSLAASHTIDLLWVAAKIASLYDRETSEFQELTNSERLSDPSWSKTIERRILVLGETIVACRKLERSAQGFTEIAFQVKKLVADFVSYFRAAERDLGRDPPRWMVVELAKHYTAACSPRLREWTEFAALVADALPPGDTLDPTVDSRDSVDIEKQTVRKIQLSSVYGKFGLGKVTP